MQLSELDKTRIIPTPLSSRSRLRRPSMPTGLMMAKIGALLGLLWRPAAVMPGGIGGWIAYLFLHRLTEGRSFEPSTSVDDTDDWTAPTLRPGAICEEHKALPSTRVLFATVAGATLLVLALSDLLTILV
jgi:hypothetical protein